MNGADSMWSLRLAMFTHCITFGASTLLCLSILVLHVGNQWYLSYASTTVNLAIYSMQASWESRHLTFGHCEESSCEHVCARFYVNMGFHFYFHDLLAVCSSTCSFVVVFIPETLWIKLHRHFNLYTILNMCS